MQNSNIFRWLVAAVIALLVAYLRVTGYLPDSGPEAANEAQTVAVNEYETADLQTSVESESAVALEAQTTAENEQEAAENQTSTENTQAQISSLTRDDFCRTTYEVFVYSFCDSDGDGIGDLPGLISKLDYINDGDPAGGEDLGMTGLWLMPVFPSNTYHKYDATDFVGIDPSYGTLEDMDALIAECHERGMTVILDLAVNHTSTAHPWFQEAAGYLRSLPPGRDAVKEECPYVWYYQFAREQYDGYVPLPDSEWYYEARFWSEMPDLNLTTGEVRQELKNVIDFWLDRGVDGFRLDAVTSYYTDNPEAGIEFTRWLTRTAKEKNPSAYIVGEAWADQNTYAQFYRSGIDSLFDFAFAGRDGIIARTVNGAGDLRYFAEAMAQEEGLYASLNPSYVNAPFYSNHDMDRGAEYYTDSGGEYNVDSSGESDMDSGTEPNVYGKSAKIKLAEALNLLMPGNAFIYYGEELGMKGAGRDENRRAPMHWSDDPQAAGMCAGPAGMETILMEYGSLEKQASDPDSIISYVREAVRIRESLPAIARGKTVLIPELEEDRFVGFLRTGAAEQEMADADGAGDADGAEDIGNAGDAGTGNTGDVLILINTGDTAVTRRLPDSLAEYTNLCAALYTGDRNSLINDREITVPAGGILFLQKP